MGETADRLADHPEDDPEFIRSICSLIEMLFCEWKSMFGWDERIAAEPNPKERRKLEALARAEYLAAFDA